MDPQTASRLVHIPLEVLTRITYFISTVDLGNIRLTCKAIEGRLFSFFSHEFFRKKQFMVSTDSLQTLIDISKHPTLSPCLKHVIIGTDRLWGNPVQQVDDGPKKLAELALADRMHLLATGGLKDMLVEAFANLANLETVDIRDFGSRSRSRDGLGVAWSSYGANTLSQSTGMAVTANAFTNEDPYPTQIFSAVVCALAVAEARPNSIEVLLRNGRGWSAWGLQDAAFLITPRMELPTTQLLSGLRSLHLALTDHSSFNNQRKPFMVQMFLSLAPNLTWLRLNWAEHANRSGSYPLLPWLALKDTEKSDSLTDMPPIQLRHLERLDLGNITMTPHTLLKLVSKFSPSLTWLSLRRVALKGSENEGREKINPWSGTLTKLARVSGSSLRKVELSLLSHAMFNGWKGQVRFRRDEDEKAAFHALHGDWMCETSVLTLETATAEAVSHMEVEWPPEPVGMDKTLHILKAVCLLGRRG